VVQCHLRSISEPSCHYVNPVILHEVGFAAGPHVVEEPGPLRKICPADNLLEGRPQIAVHPSVLALC